MIFLFVFVSYYLYIHTHTMMSIVSFFFLGGVCHRILFSRLPGSGQTHNDIMRDENNDCKWKWLKDCSSTMWLFWLRRWQTAWDHLLHGYTSGTTQYISGLNNCKQNLYHGNQSTHISSQKRMIQIPKDIQGMYPINTAASETAERSDSRVLLLHYDWMKKERKKKQTDILS